MGYEWDESKRESNVEWHGVDFAIVDGFEWDASLTIMDERKEYGEDRFISVAPIRGRLHVLVWTPRDGNVRVISLRKANKREVRDYERQTQEQ